MIIMEKYGNTVSWFTKPVSDLDIKILQDYILINFQLNCVGQKFLQLTVSVILLWKLFFVLSDFIVNSDLQI